MTRIPSTPTTLAGIETDPLVTSPSTSTGHPFQFGHVRLIQAVLHDQTDGCTELVQQNEWLLHTSQGELKLRGNVFALENTLDGTGTAFLKLAPLPGTRSQSSDWDVWAARDGHLQLSRADGYEWVSMGYTEGKWGRIAAFHALQRQIRPYDSRQDGLLLTNTWGDRNRDAHLNPEFMAREIEAAARLGADVVQIDDGWQQGTTANSAKARDGGGAWNGFWASDDHFWDVNRERFPQGMSALCEQARSLGLQIGLWFAPDSSQEAANWERDADALLKLHRELGVNCFKIDALKIESAQSEANFQKLFAKVQDESRGAVSFDLDITAERRFGYFGAIRPGRLFVENRYTDWRSYWPHHTLRVAWQLSHWIDPVRLRLEWLNNTRNTDKYQSDPLAPVNYRADTLFATTMMCSPLGWFENQHLPPEYFAQAAPLIAIWKKHREAMQNGTILPVGDAPDGRAWTGFASVNTSRTGGYALLFRELNPSPVYELSVPLVGKLDGPVEVLGGQGTASLSGGVLSCTISQPLSFLWVKFGA